MTTLGYPSTLTNAISPFTHTHTVTPTTAARLRGVGPTQEAEDALRKLASLAEVMKEPSFHLAGIDQAIEILGPLDPLYCGIPAALAETLLTCCAVYRPLDYSLTISGLFYFVPAVFGESYGVRTSHTGVKLLDYWAEEHPKFAPFVDAYVSQVAREDITSDCFDLGMGKMPTWIKQRTDKAMALQERYVRQQNRKAAAEAVKHAAKAQQQQSLYEEMRWRDYQQHQDAMRRQLEQARKLQSQIMGSATTSVSTATASRGHGLFGSLFGGKK